MNPDLLSALSSRRLLCDGAMGTQLMLRGLAPGACGEKWNMDRPADVEAIHRAYRQAGCELITSNTFGATSTNLDRHGLGDRAADINRAGAELACRAAKPGGWALGDIGPFGGFLEPVGDMSEAVLSDVFKQQVAALYAGGADAIIVETMSDPREMKLAIEAAKAMQKDKPVIATYAFGKRERSFFTMMGNTVEECIGEAIKAGADVVGANCGTSLDLNDYLRLAERVVKAVGKTPAIFQPNAGSPQMISGKLVHPASPADMAAMASRLIEMGFRIIGGCCGTTPEHLRAMAAAVRQS